MRTYEWHTGDIPVTYGWHTSTYDCHTDGIRIHIGKIQAHANDMWMTCQWHKKY